MEAHDVLEVLEALAAAEVRVWLDGGWGVDALLGEQTRDHADLDLLVGASEASRLEDALRPLGFRARPGGASGNLVLTDGRGREVDVHPVRFDARGHACFELLDGRRWPFPPAALDGRGSVAGRPVRCLSADAQVQCHGQGYDPDENDLRDMERLQQRFGVVLPIHLCRQPSSRSVREAPGPGAPTELRLSLRHALVFAPHLAVARRFYGEVLELRLEREGEGFLLFGGGDFHLSVFECASVRDAESYSREAGSSIVFSTPSLDRAVARLRERGVRMLHAEPERGPLGRYVAFADPFGTVHELLEAADA